MVLTRAQSKTTAKSPSSGANALKAPARRVKAVKKTKDPDEHEPPKPATKSAVKSKDPVPSKARSSVPAAATKSTRSRKAVAPKPETPPKEATATKTKTARTVAMKTTTAKTTSKRPTTRNRQEKKEASSASISLPPQPMLPPPIVSPAATSPSQNQQRSAVPVLSINKLAQSISPFKSSSLSPFKSLGSPIKLPAQTKMLSMSPAKSLMRSPIKAVSQMGSPVRQETGEAPTTQMELERLPRRFKQSSMDQKSSSPIRSPARAPLVASFHTSPVRSLKRGAEPIGFDMRSSKRLANSLGEDNQPMLSRSAIRSPAKMYGPSTVSFSPSKSTAPTSPSKPTIQSPAKPQTLKKAVSFNTSSRILAFATPSDSQSTPSRITKPPIHGGEDIPNPATIPDLAAFEPARPLGILSGLTFFVDVRGSDGSCANHYFIPLLQDLGAEVVPNWSSNTMDVTHVLFKDGELRTLEKVVASNDIVKCVNIGWAVDCERFGVLLPEEPYMIDLLRVPGLHTPTKALSILSTNTTPATSRAPAAYTPASTMATSRNRTPKGDVGDIEMVDVPSSPLIIKTPSYLASKPLGGSINGGEDDKENMSPMSESTPLVQKTCPPKQLNQPIFLLDRIGSTPFKRKLMQGRRKTAGSPLRIGWGVDDC